MKQHDIEPIDMVVVNLYPFEQTIAREGVTLEEAIEQIDIGGPAMIRSAAKNWHDVAVIVFRQTNTTTLREELKLHDGALSAIHPESNWPAQRFQRTSTTMTIATKPISCTRRAGSRSRRRETSCAIQ